QLEIFLKDLETVIAHCNHKLIALFIILNHQTHVNMSLSFSSHTSKKYNHTHIFRLMYVFLGQLISIY
ncbi:MAG TPA: hypothetical protein VJY12_07655, partial [Dysgonamonadaceae bacterium]|nr:hypothetical protein [Dysgonamonadaceae bacterium]